MLFEQKKIRVKDNKLYILDKELKKKIDNIKLSPSMIDSFLKSPADYVMDKFIAPSIQKSNPIYLDRGSCFHEIMEHFYSSLKETERNSKALKEIAKKVIIDKYNTIYEDEESREWINNALKCYWELWGKDAKDEKLAQIFLLGKTWNGTEVFVTGKIGECKRQTVAFIDKLVEGSKGLKIYDYKTNKAVTEYDSSKKISENNPFDYSRQQIAYTLLLEKYGIMVEEASLLFPVADPPQKVDIEIFSEEQRKQVIKDFEEVDKALSECIENGYVFPFKKGKYNKWASYLCGLGNAFKPDIYEDKLFEILEIE